MQWHGWIKTTTLIKSHIVWVHAHQCLNQVNWLEWNKTLDASMVWGAEGKKWTGKEYTLEGDRNDLYLNLHSGFMVVYTS